MARKKYDDFEKELIQRISINLQNLLKAKNWNQTSLSEKSGISKSTISDYVNGRTLISPTNLHRLSQALDVSENSIYPVSFNESKSDIKLLELDKLQNYQVTYKGMALTKEESSDLADIIQIVLTRWKL